MKYASGGKANWLGANFEKRVATESLITLLLDGRVSTQSLVAVRLQAASRPDDIHLFFHDGTEHRVSVKSGALRYSWNSNERFVSAIDEFIVAFNDRNPNLTRLVLSTEAELCSRKVHHFGRWLDKVRCHPDLSSLSESSTSQEENQFLDDVKRKLSESVNDIHDFLALVHVEGSIGYEQWFDQTVIRLAQTLGISSARAKEILFCIESLVAKYSSHGGLVNRNALDSALGNTGAARTAVPARVLRVFRREDLHQLTDYVVQDQALGLQLIERPELICAEPSTLTVVTGRPGSGKSRALATRCLSDHPATTIVVGPRFREEHLPALREVLVREPCVLLWDDVEANNTLVTETVAEVCALENHRILLSCSQQESLELIDNLHQWTPNHCSPTLIKLVPFDYKSLLRLVTDLEQRIGLELCDETRNALVDHAFAADGGPRFAVSLGRLVKQKTTGRIRPEDVAKLPSDLVLVWRSLYRSLNFDRTAQTVLKLFRFFAQRGIRVGIAGAEAVAGIALDIPNNDFDLTVERLLESGWLVGLDEVELCHEVCIAAIPNFSSHRQDRIEGTIAFNDKIDGEIGLRLRCDLVSYLLVASTVAVSENEATSAAVRAATVGMLAIDKVVGWHNSGSFTELQITTATACNVAAAQGLDSGSIFGSATAIKLSCGEAGQERRNWFLEKGAELAGDCIARVISETAVSPDLLIAQSGLIKVESCWARAMLGTKTGQERTALLEEARSLATEVIRFSENTHNLRYLALGLITRSNTLFYLASEGPGTYLWMAFRAHLDASRAIVICQLNGFVRLIAAALLPAAASEARISSFSEGVARSELLESSRTRSLEASKSFEYLGLSELEAHALSNCADATFELGENEQEQKRVQIVRLGDAAISAAKRSGNGIALFEAQVGAAIRKMELGKLDESLVPSAVALAKSALHTAQNYGNTRNLGRAYLALTRTVVVAMECSKEIEEEQKWRAYGLELAEKTIQAHIDSDYSSLLSLSLLLARLDAKTETETALTLLISIAKEAIEPSLSDLTYDIGRSLTETGTDTGRELGISLVIAALNSTFTE